MRKIGPGFLWDKEKRTMKKSAVCFILGIMCASFCVAGGAAYYAEAEDETSSSVPLQMVEGASVRIAEGEKGLSGIRWKVTMPTAEYDALEKDEAYTDVSYGILIAPYDYHEQNPLTAASVFGCGGEKTYTWEGDEGADEESGYTPIINLETETLFTSDKDPGNVHFYGSVVDVKPDNFTRKFIGVGYIAYIGTDGEVSYGFAAENDNARSAAYVAQKAIDDETENKPTDTQKAWLQELYIDPVLEKVKFDTVTESDESIVFQWTAVKGAKYQIVRTGDDTIVAETEEITAVVEKDGSYVKDAEYALRVNFGGDAITENADLFKTTEFGWGLVNQINTEADALERISVTGANAEYNAANQSLVLTGNGKTTAHIVSHRTMYDASFINLVLTGNGEVSVGDQAVTVNGTSCLSLTPEQFNGGFDLTFTDRVEIAEILNDYLDNNKTADWRETPGYGVASRNEGKSYTITEADGVAPDNGAVQYIFTALGMPESVDFTISAKVTASAAEYVAGFSVTSPINGRATGAVMLNSRDKKLQIFSWDGWNPDQAGNTAAILTPGSANWVMSDADYDSVDKANCIMTLIRDDTMFYFLLNEKVLAYFDSETIPLFTLNNGGGYSIKGAPLATGFALTGYIGAEEKKETIGSITYSDYTVTLTAEAPVAAVSGRVILPEGAAGTANGNIEFRAAGGTVIEGAVTAGGYSVSLPRGTYMVIYIGNGYMAYEENIAVTEMSAAVDLTAFKTRNTMLGNEATVNGQTYTQFFGDGLWGSEVNGAPVDAALQAESGENASFTIENDRRNSYVMPGTVTDKDYEYSVNVTDPNSTFCSFAGLFVSDGTNVLALQVQNNGGLAISGGKRTDWGEPWTFVNLPEGKAIDLRNFSLKIARNGNTIEMYIDFDGTGSSGGYEKIGTVNADGSITFAEGFTAANSNTGNGVLDVSSQAAFAALLAADEHVAGLWRNSVAVQSVTYTPVFTVREEEA